MDNQKITPEQIALMRKRMDDGRTVRISEVKMLIDALEASMRREAEKDATIARLTAEAGRGSTGLATGRRGQREL